MPNPPPRVGIYARISEDRDGQQTATERQLKDCRELAARKGWEVVDQFEDVDVSAYSKKVQRPEFERMLGALRAGDVDGVIVWKLDRLTRQQRDLVRVVEACDEHRAFVASVMEPIDTRETYGQFVAELLVAQARMESANTSLRQKRKHAELARAGAPVIGGSRCFGYSKDMKTTEPEEVALIHEAVERLLAGESIRGLCRDWEGRGIVTSTGGKWQTTPLKRLVISPTIAGQRRHEGELIQGTWLAIVDPAVSARLRAVLTEPGRRMSPGSARKYLLSGFLRCGLCGERLLARPRRDKVRRYVCSPQPGSRRCGGVAILAEPLEELVTEMVFQAVDNDALNAVTNAQQTESSDPVDEQLKGDEEAMEALARDFYLDRLISREEFLAARSALTRRLELNRSRAARRDRKGVLAGYSKDGQRLRQGWATGSLDWRRAVLSAVFERIIVGQAVRGRNIFDANRVVPVWRS